MPHLPELDPQLIALMESQGGVFTAEQARRFGHNSDELQRLRTRAPRPLVSVRRGVYALRTVYEGATGPARHLIEIAAVEHCLDNSPVLSDESAAVFHGLPLLDANLSRVHVTRRPPSRPRIEAGVHHHVAELPEKQVVLRPRRMSVVTKARSVVDVARGTDRLECAVAAFDSALRAGVPREELWEVFHGMRSWPGARLVARAIEMADGRAENPGESFSRVVLVRIGLPPDDLQVPMWDDEGLIGYSDFGWVGVYGELDGGTKYGLDDPEKDEHAAKQVVWREKKREDRMRVQREVVRWGIADLYRPHVLRGRVLAAMARATARGLRPA